jgi:hypothetical protein
VIVFEVDVEAATAWSTVKIIVFWADKAHAAALMAVVYAFFEAIVIIETANRTEILGKVFFTGDTSFRFLLFLPTPETLDFFHREAI